MPNDHSQNGSGGGNKLSPQTLIVASLASLTAAIVVSHFWRGGTPIAAAITPVIVAVASELYRRPAERITRLSSRAAGVTTRSRSAGPAHDAVVLTRTFDDDLAPVRVYRHERRRVRSVHIKVAVATAVVAFAIAVAVLTLPELVFGGSLASHGRTTFFGGGHHHAATTTTVTKSSSSAPAATQTTTTPVPGAAPPAGPTGP